MSLLIKKQIKRIVPFKLKINLIFKAMQKLSTTLYIPVCYIATRGKEQKTEDSVRITLNKILQCTQIETNLYLTCCFWLVSMKFNEQKKRKPGGTLIAEEFHS